MKPYLHARISVKRFGGRPIDYIAIHNWFDQTKAHIPDMRHRMVLHNSFGIYLCEQAFGVTIINSDGTEVGVRDIGEQHVIDDLGRIPTLFECFEGMQMHEWMGSKIKKLVISRADIIMED